jgi:hypothetical protein
MLKPQVARQQVDAAVGVDVIDRHSFRVLESRSTGFSRLARKNRN